MKSCQLQHAFLCHSAQFIFSQPLKGLTRVATLHLEHYLHHSHLSTATKVRGLHVAHMFKVVVFDVPRIRHCILGTIARIPPATGPVIDSFLRRGQAGSVFHGKFFNENI